jgi:hypothetical protein
MNREMQARSLVLVILIFALLSPTVMVRGQIPTPSPTPEPPAPPQIAGQKVKLYYMREATKINAILTVIAAKPGSALEGLIVANASEDELILYGNDQKRAFARRIIATLDLPRPGIVMEMWGIQISSRKPDEMAKVMARIRAEINSTQQDVREAYKELAKSTRENMGDEKLDQAFKTVLSEDLFYRSALSLDRPLSVADILLRLIADKTPAPDIVNIANEMQGWFKGKQHEWQRREAKAKLEKTKERDKPEPKVAFSRFFKLRELKWLEGEPRDDRGPGGKWDYEKSSNPRIPNAVEAMSIQGRNALLEFALHYGRLVHEPESFSSFRLQTSSEILNSRLQQATDAINLDMQEMFVEPTLARIQKIVRKFNDVEYAQVGKTSVASLSGIQAEVTSKSVNAFDVTPPLRLSELLKTAESLSNSANTFVPNPADNLVGAMPLSQVIGLIGAFGEERSVWRELSSGISLTITPNVLRNMTSAELKIILKTGDPQQGNPPQGVRPLSRVSQHDVTTSVYVEPLDFFDLSAFVSQSTLNGGRGYVPVLGPIWRGIFGEIPYAGELFSWKRKPQTSFTESLVLTTSFITPTSMGVALLYPTELVDDATGDKLDWLQSTFGCQSKAVFRFQNQKDTDNSATCLKVAKEAAEAKKKKAQQ